MYRYNLSKAIYFLLDENCCEKVLLLCEAGVEPVRTVLPKILESGLVDLSNAELDILSLLGILHQAINYYYIFFSCSQCTYRAFTGQTNAGQEAGLWIRIHFINLCGSGTSSFSECRSGSRSRKKNHKGPNL